MSNGFSSRHQSQSKELINYQSLHVLGKRTRQENGLVELTKKFIELLIQADQNTIDLNDAVELLKV